MLKSISEPRLLPDIAVGLILSSDKPLDFHVIILLLFVSVLKYFIIS